MIKKTIIVIILIVLAFALLMLPGKFNPLYLLLYVPILAFGVKEFRK